MHAGSRIVLNNHEHMHLEELQVWLLMHTQSNGRRCRLILLAMEWSRRPDGACDSASVFSLLTFNSGLVGCASCRTGGRGMASQSGGGVACACHCAAQLRAVRAVPCRAACLLSSSSSIFPDVPFILGTLYILLCMYLHTCSCCTVVPTWLGSLVGRWVHPQDCGASLPQQTRAGSILALRGIVPGVALPVECEPPWRMTTARAERQQPSQKQAKNNAR